MVEMEPTKQTDQNEICIPRDLMMQAAMLRLGSVDKEINAGYEVLKKYHKTVTIFGSARLSETSKYYQAAHSVSAKLAAREYAVISGGGHGIMGAANAGAKQAGGHSIGFNIQLPHEQTLNDHTTDSLSFSHFSPRKIVMTLFANAYIYFPGGFGTLDELAEILTLIQTHKTTPAPVILFGSEFWGPFDDFIKNQLRDELQLITPGDENLYVITDDEDEVVKIVESNQTYCNHKGTTSVVPEGLNKQ